MTRTRLHDLRSDDGIAIVVAIILMTLMLSMGLAAITLTDSQSRLTAQQRQRESAFNVAEASLNAQVTQISRHWAGVKAYTTDPTQRFGTCPAYGTFCPSDAELTSMIPSADISASAPVTWQTQVFDNVGNIATHFQDSQIPANDCGCDSNNDGKVWVRAQATVRNHTRAIVSLVQQQWQREAVPHAAVLAGSLTIDNNGLHNSPILDANGGLLAVRCSPPLNSDGTEFNGTETSTTPCMGQPAGVSPTQTLSDWNSLLNNQISGFPTKQLNYSMAPIFTQDQIQRFIDTAQSENTYYTGCPSSLSGAVVVINVVGNCSYTGNTTYNTQQDPGFLVLLNAQSSLSLSGGATYYGIVYHANQSNPPTIGWPNTSDTLISVTGNGRIQGGVLVEGYGRVEIGDSAGANQGSNIQFDDHGYDSVKSYAAAGIIQNSWREIQPGA